MQYERYNVFIDDFFTINGKQYKIMGLIIKTDEFYKNPLINQYAEKRKIIFNANKLRVDNNIIEKVEDDKIYINSKYLSVRNYMKYILRLYFFKLYYQYIFLDGFLYIANKEIDILNENTFFFKKFKNVNHIKNDLITYSKNEEKNKCYICLNDCYYVLILCKYLCKNFICEICFEEYKKDITKFKCVICGKKYLNIEIMKYFIFDIREIENDEVDINEIE